VRALLFSDIAVSIVGKSHEFPTVVTKDVAAQSPHLPEADLPCSIKVAYHAADAGHPGMGRASSPPSKQISSGSSVLIRLCAAKARIGKGII
jgi:hypothetical protein